MSNGEMNACAVDEVPNSSQQVHQLGAAGSAVREQWTIVMLSSHSSTLAHLLETH